MSIVYVFSNASIRRNSSNSSHLIREKWEIRFSRSIHVVLQRTKTCVQINFFIEYSIFLGFNHKQEKKDEKQLLTANIPIVAFFLQQSIWILNGREDETWKTHKLNWIYPLRLEQYMRIQCDPHNQYRDWYSFDTESAEPSNLSNNFDNQYCDRQIGFHAKYRLHFNVCTIGQTSNGIVSVRKREGERGICTWGSRR